MSEHREASMLRLWDASGAFEDFVLLGSEVAVFLAGMGFVTQHQVGGTPVRQISSYQCTQPTRLVFDFGPISRSK